MGTELGAGTGVGLGVCQTNHVRKQMCPDIVCLQELCGPMVRNVLLQCISRLMLVLPTTPLFSRVQVFDEYAKDSLALDLVSVLVWVPA